MDSPEVEGQSGEMPFSQCPRCGQWVVDTEFGVIRHESCGYCKHPARDLVNGKWRCGICGDEKEES